MLPSNKDFRRLIRDMDAIADGNCEEVDVSRYRNPLYGEKLNNVIKALKKANNPYVMRLNELMESVGDNALIKDTFDQITSQTQSIVQMESASQEMESAIRHISGSMRTIQENTHEMSNAFGAITTNMNDSIRDIRDSAEMVRTINGQMHEFHQKIIKIGEIIDLVKRVSIQSKLLALNASLEAARAGAAGKGFSVVAEEMQQLSVSTTESAENITEYVRQLNSETGTLVLSIEETTQKLNEGNVKATFSLHELEQMNAQIAAIQEQIDSIFREIDTQNNTAADFSQQAEMLSESYRILSTDCVALGKHVFQIGRYVDKTRSDMVRNSSAITELDWLRVFQVDHFVLTWRVYNNIVGFEQLQAKQVDNPDTCKLGKWLASQTDSALAGSSEFRQLADAHAVLHTYAAQSWKAKQEGNDALALQAFQDTYKAFQTFDRALVRLREKMQSLGYREETPVPPLEN